MAKTEELKIEHWDLETYLELFLAGGYDPKEDKWVQFEVSKRRNDLDAFVKYKKENPVDYYCYFNGIGFDGQVVQFILNNHESWWDKSWNEITALIYEFVQKIIDDQNFELPPPYKEQYMDIRIIDPFLILHMNNQNRRTSLKWCEYGMDMDIEELPIEPGRKNLTDEEIEDIIRYWKHDIKALHMLYRYITGDTEHEDYKGSDNVQLRLDLIEEFKLPATAINWNDVKIGVELNKKHYLELTGMTNQKMWEKVKSKKSQKGFRFRDCYPKYIKFESKEFSEFFKKVGEKVVDLNNKQEFPFTYNGTNYMMAKGGGHSSESARYIEPEEGWILIDCDVSSMYPNIIRKHCIYPAHLGKPWNTVYIGNIPRRIEAKQKYKETKDKKQENFAKVFKLSLNGPFGKLIDRRDPTYDPLAGMRTTIGGQVDIFMLAEDFELGGHHVVSMNTDGLTVLTKLDRIEDYYRICKEWEIQVGNDEIGKLEYIEYKFLAQLSVNDYIALKEAEWKEKDGKFIRVPMTEPIGERTKKKGDFLTSYELHKNKSKSIVPIALEQYFIHGKPVEETIENHRSIWDFCMAKKASRDYGYEGVNRKTGEVNRYNRLVRYFCSTEGEKIWKYKKEGSEKTGPARSQCESTSQHQQLFNRPYQVSDFSEYKVDYQWYIAQTKKILHQIKPELKLQDQEAATGQLNLFS